MSTIFQIPVKMGSRKLTLEIDSRTTIKSEQFIELALKKCKLNDNLTRTYSLFENVSGVERLITTNDNICDLWKYWSTESSKKQTIEFIIRKCFTIEKKVKVNNEKRQQMIKKCYEKMNADQTKQDLFTQIIQNEQQLKRQSEKLQQVEQIIANLKQQQNQKEEPTIKSLLKNVNFLQFLNFKLKNPTQQNRANSYEKLTESSFCEEESISDCEDNYDLKRTSTSTLESLV